MHIVCPHCRNPIEIVKLTPREEVACTSCGSTFLLESEPTTTPEHGTGQKLGRFKILDTVGQGAFGTVYRARDPELDRTVAIKVPRAGELAGPHEIERFLREGRSVAQLRHPSIVSVHEVGQSDGVPYLVSDFVEGVTLTDLLSARRPGFREAAELIASLAEALHFAHEHGVVHRDIKPSNVMIGADGKPCVMDFGMAKRDAGEVTMTVEGQVLGTPAYMSPEQARGEGHAVDGRSDIYSLGVILYELLSGERPFRGTKRMLLHQVQHDDPKPPRNLNDKIPRDVETICLKAMAKEPSRRYGTGRELAEDLRRWLNGEAIRARPVGRVERLVRWVRRRPVVAALVVVSGVAALALVGLAVGLVYNVWLNDAYQKEAVARQGEEDQRRKAEEALGVAEAAKTGEQEQRKRAEDALKLADRLAYVHSISLADVAMRDNNMPLVRERLQECKEELRGWEWYYLNAQCHAELFSFPPGSGLMSSPHGAVRVASVGKDEVLRVYDAQSSQDLLTLKAPAPLGATAFSQDGKRVAVGSLDGAVRVYEARTSRELLALKGPAPLGLLQFSPDGGLIAAASNPDRGDGAIHIYDARSGRELLALKAPAGLRFVEFSPDGGKIIFAPVPKDYGAVRVYDARTGQELIPPTGSVQLRSKAFSPDGERVAAASKDGAVRVYDARSGRELLALKGPALLSSPAFSPDGERVAASGKDGVVRVYEARTGQEILALKGAGRLGIPVYSPDGLRVALSPNPFGDSDGVVRVYDARSGGELFTLKGPAPLWSLQFSPDGSLITTRPDPFRGDGVVRVYDARGSQEVLALEGLFVPSIQAFSPDGERVAASGKDGAVRVYDARSGRELLALKGPAPLSSPAFSPDGGRVAAGSEDGAVRLYDARTGRELLAVKGPGPLRAPAISPDGGLIAAAPDPDRGDGAVRVYDVRTGQGLLTIKVPSPVLSLRFSSDGGLIACVPYSDRGDGVAHVYDARTGRELLALNGLAPLGSLVFSPHGERVAAASKDGAVRVYDARTGQEFLTLKGPVPLWSLQFSPDGERVAAASKDGAVRVYDARSGRELLALKGPAQLSSPAFSPDGERVVASSNDGSVRVYDARAGKELLALKVPTSFDLLKSFGFSPDGRRIAVYTMGGPLYVWEAPRDLEEHRRLKQEGFRAGIVGWHREQAAECERTRYWFGAAFHLQHLCELEPDPGPQHYRYGLALSHLRKEAVAKQAFEKALSLKASLSEATQAEAHAMLGQWEDAAKLVVNLAEVPKASLAHRWWHVLLRLQLGDQEGYSKACTTTVERFGTTKDPRTANSVAWHCTLAPVSESDRTAALRLARFAVQSDPKNASFRDTLGCILYRAGQFEESIAELNEAIKLHPGGGNLHNFAFLAMAHHRLQNADDARKWLEKTVQAFEINTRVEWQYRIQFRIHLREAEQLIRGQPDQSGKPSN